MGFEAQYLFIMLDYKTLNEYDKSKLNQTNSAYISAFLDRFRSGISSLFFILGGPAGWPTSDQGGPGPHLAPTWLRPCI